MGVGGSRGQSAAVASVVAPIVAATRGNNAAPQLLTFEMLDDDRDEKVPIETDQLAMDFGSLCGNRKFSDVTFIVGQREREKFYAHRMLLAARSKVFEAMFFSHFAESRGGDIEIPDVSPSAWRILMSAIYKDQVTLSGDVIIEVVYVAKKYQVHSLTAMALRFMQKGLTPDNACSLLEMAPHLLEDEKFAIDFIEKNAIEVMESPGFLNLTPHALSRVIRCDNLGMPELELFEKILLWAGKECERRKLEGTKPNMRRVLEPILPCIRFPTMSMEDVTLQVAPTELLTKDQLLAIYVWIGSKPESRLPIAFPTQPRAHGRSLWRLDTMRASPSVTLSQGNMHAKLMAHGHGYFLGSKEFSRGRHCWRVHLDRLDGAQWVFLGIVATQRRDKLKNMSFSDTSVYGFSTKNQIYHGGPTRRQHYWNRKFPTVDWNRQGAIIDLMLDCDESSLRILNTSSRREWKIERLPRRSYVPHFNVYDLNNEIRVETLRPEDWGVLSVNPTPASAAPPRRRRS